MPTEGINTRVRGSMTLGNYLKSSIAPLLIGGALVVGNNVFFTAGKNGDNLPYGQENLVATQSYESGAYIAYQEEKAALSGSYRMQSQFQLTTTTVASGAILHRLAYECGDKMNTAKTVSISYNRLPLTGSAGTVIQLRRTVGSGGTIEINTGSHLVLGGYYLTAVTASGAAHSYVGNDCMFKAWYHAKHGQ